MGTTFNIVLPKKKVLINQPYFLGDIIFVMALVQKYVNEGYDVIYPVRDEYMNLQKNFPTIKLIPLSRFPMYEQYNRTDTWFEDSEYIVISLRHSYLRKGLPYHMKDKYEGMGLQLDLWREIKIVRDFETEKKLFTELGLNPDEKYNLINEFERPFFHRIPITVVSPYKNVYMSKLKEFSLLDWIGVMEKAQSIHAIGSAIQYLMETIPTMPKDLHIYRRWDENTNRFHDHKNYSFLFNKEYIYH
jgi:hypothetical protein